MPYTRVTRTSFGADAIKYARGTGRGHNGVAARNQIVTSVNMAPDDIVPFERQMQPYWDRADPRHTNQINRFIVSFSRDELDPDNPDDIMKAADICRDFALEIAPQCQSAIFVQTDGASGLIHGHVLVNDVQFTDFKGLAKSARYFPAFSGTANRICRSYFDAKEPGEGLAPERVNQNVRHQREANRKIREQNEKERREAEAQGREAKLAQEKYIWQDDLRARIMQAAQAAADEDEFAELLREDGVELIPEYGEDGEMSYRRHATKTQPVHYVYELVDTSGFSGKIPKNLKSKSHKLGANYQPDGIEKLFGQTRQAVEQKPAPVQVAAEPAPDSVQPIPAPAPKQRPAPAHRVMPVLPDAEFILSVDVIDVITSYIKDVLTKCQVSLGNGKPVEYLAMDIWRTLSSGHEDGEKSPVLTVKAEYSDKEVSLRFDEIQNSPMLTGNDEVKAFLDLDVLDEELDAVLHRMELADRQRHLDKAGYVDLVGKAAALDGDRGLGDD